MAAHNSVILHDRKKPPPGEEPRTLPFGTQLGGAVSGNGGGFPVAMAPDAFKVSLEQWNGFAESVCEERRRVTATQGRGR